MNGFSSTVRLTDTAVIKTFREDYIQHRGAQVERERKALSILESVEGIPLLLARTEREFYMTHCGEPLTAANLPKDAEEQGRMLVERMQKRAVHHNDVHPGNLLVKDGRLHLIDFGWATFGNEAKTFLPAELGVEYGVRAKDDPFDDAEMMARSLRLLRAKS